MKPNGKCKFCGAEVVWVTDLDGPRVALDPEIVERREGTDGFFTLRGDWGKAIAVRVASLYRQHYQTCPNQKDWHKR